MIKMNYFLFGVFDSVGIKFKLCIINILLICRLLQHSVCLEELDLDVNLIGDMAGRQILAALEARAAGKHLKPD